MRWLWLDHVPPGLTLTGEQRQRVVELARRKRHAQPTFRTLTFTARLWLLVAIPTILILYIGWIALLPRIGFGLIGTIFANAGSILLFNGLLWWCIAWAVHRTNAPYVRWALWEMGKPVCVNCGYILTGADDPLQPCPECGTRHLAKPQSDKRRDSS